MDQRGNTGMSVQRPLFLESLPDRFRDLKGLPFDLEYKIKTEYPEVKDRKFLDRVTVKNWKFKMQGKYLIAYLNGKYNLVIKNNKPDKFLILVRFKGKKT